ncbi:CpsD/CapB family tyrosine-protein kinase [Cohnella soli]|uniref:non-specific protein-tyrosine kinase n=1 Tax=Cohnella soli TaxID=425005 RepID=A0ABW0I0H5_9BACL
MFKNKKLSKTLIGGCLASYHQPYSNLAEQFREIRNNITFAARGNLRSLVVTSPSDGEGKTTAAMNLAIGFAQRGERVLLVDADIRKPLLHSLFDMQASPGLSEILVQQAKLEEAVRETNIPNLKLLLGGSFYHEAMNRLESVAMTELLNQARALYDVLVFDCPSVLGASDVCTLASRCDGTVLVLSGGRTNSNKALLAKRNLEFGKANILGVVLMNGKSIT